MQTVDELTNRDLAGRDGDSASSERWLMVWVSFVLAVLVAAIYAQAARFDFIDYDDSEYVYENTHVMSGLSLDNVSWAFTSKHAANWHPLTWISHMIDVEMFGNWPGGHHLTSVVIHAATALLLFLALCRLTGSLWPSAFAAAAFAVHPLRVESVAWVAERKDVLCGLFFALTLLAYAGYARRPSVFRYSLVVLALAFGLMAKPMLVTVPFVLLLLDYWPLERLHSQSDSPSATPRPWRVLLEKAPLLILAAASAAMTVWAQMMAIASIEKIPWWDRISNAANSYMAYLRQLFWPSGLTVPYPHPGSNLPLAEVIGTMFALLALSAGAILSRRRRPYVTIGWFWYLGMLVPVIGLMQVGSQARADRYTYLPQIGLFVAIAWSAADWAGMRMDRRNLLIAAAVCVLAILSWCSWRQAAHWHNGLTLFAHAATCTPGNVVALNNLGGELERRGQDASAADQFRQAVASSPRHTLSVCNYGLVLVRLGRFDEAAKYLRQGYELDPSNNGVLIQLGVALQNLGRLDEAEIRLRQALERDPQSAAANDAFGIVRAEQGRLADAVLLFEKAVRLAPADKKMRANLALGYYKSGKPREALNVLRDSLRMRPDDLTSLRLAAWVAATTPDAKVRSGPDAVAWSERANQLTGGLNPLDLDVLAAAYAEMNRFKEALEVATRALKQALDMHENELADKIRRHTDLYRNSEPVRETASKSD